MNDGIEETRFFLDQTVEKWKIQISLWNTFSGHVVDDFRVEYESQDFPVTSFEHFICRYRMFSPARVDVRESKLRANVKVLCTALRVFKDVAHFEKSKPF